MSYAIRKARLEDFEEIYSIFQRVLRAGDTYYYTPEEMTPERAMSYWISAPHTHCYVVDVENKVEAMSAIRPYRTGRGNHLANAAFVVDPDHRGKGIGRALADFTMNEAKELGYKAMLFHAVISANTAAVKLWQSLGMKIIGTIPQGFLHNDHGLVDVYLMHKAL